MKGGAGDKEDPGALKKKAAEEAASVAKQREYRPESTAPPKLSQEKANIEAVLSAPRGGAVGAKAMGPVAGYRGLGRVGRQTVADSLAQAFAPVKEGDKKKKEKK